MHRGSFIKMLKDCYCFFYGVEKSTSLLPKKVLYGLLWGKGLQMATAISDSLLDRQADKLLKGRHKD